MKLPLFLARLFQPSPAVAQAHAQEQHESQCKRHDFRGKIDALSRLTEVAHREMDANEVRLRMIGATAREKNEVGNDDRDRPGRVADDNDPA